MTSSYAAIGAAAAPTFSRDGRTLYHLRGAGTPQLWSMGLDGGGDRALAEMGEKTFFLRRAPNDERIIFGTDAGGDERQQLWLYDGGVPLALTEAPAVIHDFGAWSPDGTQFAYAANDRDEAHFDVLVRPVSGPPRRIYQGTHQLAVAAWHPEGDRLLLLADEAEGDQALLVLSLADGTARIIPHHRPAAFKSLRWTKAGELFGLSDAGGEFVALHRIDPDTGALTLLAEAPGRDLEAWSLALGDTVLATVENDRGYAIVRIGPIGAERRVVSGLPHGVAGELAWAPDGSSLALSASGPTTPPGIYLVDPATAQARAVWVPEAPAALASFHLVAWTSFDGKIIPGWFATPPGAAPETGWPVVVWVHGGPAGQTRANFRADMQMLLAQGYAVLMPNVRGSTGYGRAYTASDDVGARLDSVHDLAASHAWLVAQPSIDPARIGIMGQSYGGYMVLAAMGEYPALWRSVVDYYGIADFTTLLADTGPWRKAHRSREYGDPDRDAALFARISPIKQAAAMTAPLLVLHGTRDPRVPYGESEQIVAAMRGFQRDVTFETFDYAGHGFIRPEDRDRAYRLVAAFFARTL
ncbi:S9 family peptidase [Acidisphaera sp. L21]|uniref:S9 family peptidase n=1 Tax=Acidisphaera sp. L21 TaxID=1641851 RepID=UPI00131AA549|nr:S9 family peptidase [Acidisphaera sp. L21]